jgi:hypothetical protein
LQNLAPGTYAAHVRLVGEARHLNSDRRRIRLAAGQHIRGLRFVFGEGPAVWGYVTDAAGLPISNASVRAEHMSEPRFTIASDTQGDGFYLIQGLPQGDYAFLLSAGAKGFIGSGFARDATPNSAWDFVLLPRPLVEGRVVRSDTGEPVRCFGVFIGMTPSDPERELESWGGAIHYQGEPSRQERLRPGFQYSEVRDKDGHFSQYAVGSGNVTVRVVTPGLAMTREHLVGLQPGELVRGVVVRMEPGRAVEGRVVGGSGLPIQDAAVFVGYPPIWHSRGDIRPIYAASTAAKTDARGRFRIDALPTDVRRLSAFHPDYAPRMMDLVWPARGDAQVEFMLTDGGLITGRAFTDGKPLGEGHCNVSAMLPSMRRGCVAHDTTDGQGSFRLMEVTPGVITIRASLDAGFLPEGIEHWIETDVEVEDGKPTRLDIAFTGSHDAAIEGVVHCEAGPVRGATLELRTERDDGSRACFWTAADLDGNYRFEPVPAGPLTGRVMGVVQGGPSFDQAFSVLARSGEVVQRDIHVMP